MMMPNTIPRDASLDRAMVFAKNHRPSGGLSNLYVIKLVNNNGEVVDEKYGMNLFTDYGMGRYFVNSDSFPIKLFVGNGNGSIVTGSQVLLNKIPECTTSASVIDSSSSYDFPLYFDPNYGDGTEGGLITCIMKYKTFAYQSADVSGEPNFTMTEYGIGSDIDSLWTHSWIYDSSGNKTYIQRHDADNIIFEVYFCFSYTEKLINDARGNGVYPVITTMQRFMSRMQSPNSYTYKRNNIKAARTVNRTQSTLINKKYSITYNISEFQLANTTADEQGYVNGFVQYYDGFSILTPESRSTGEAFVTSPLANEVSGLLSSKSFSDKFGTIVEMPFTKANISAVNAFDFNTKTWVAPLRYNAAVDHDYCETPLQPTMAVPIWYTNNNQYRKMYVYQNVYDTDDILAIQSTCETIYAATKYWDKNTWVNITNYANIPSLVRRYPYWIASSNSDSTKITTTRASGTFYLKPHNGSGDDDGYSILPYSASNTGSTKACCGNPTYKWYAIGDRVYAENTLNPYSFKVFPSGYSPDDMDSDWGTYDKWAWFTHQQTNSLYLFDMTNVVTTQPSPVTVTLNFTASIHVTNTYMTESKTGLFCYSDTTSGNNEAVVIDVRGSVFNPSTNITKLTNTTIASCIHNTNKTAYVDSVNGVVKVRNIDTQLDTYSRALPSGFGTATFIFGIDNYIWISDNTNSYVINTNADTITACDRVIDGSINASGHNRMRVQASSDIFLMYHKDNAINGSQSSLIMTTNPSHNMNVSEVIV